MRKDYLRMFVKLAKKQKVWYAVYGGGGSGVCQTIAD